MGDMIRAGDNRTGDNRAVDRGVGDNRTGNRGVGKQSGIQKINNITIRSKFVFGVMVLMVLSSGILLTFMVHSQRRAVSTRLQEALEGYAHITASVLKYNAQMLAQQTGVVSKDRQLIGSVKCWANVGNGDNECLGDYVPDDIKAKFPDQPAAAILQANPALLSEFKKFLHGKIRENSVGDINQYKAINPDINKLSFYYKGQAVFRSFSDKYGDAVSRSMVEATAKEKKSFGGVGIDDEQVGFFQSIPVFFTGEYIVGEIGIPFSAMLRDIQAVTGVEHIAYVSADKKLYDVLDFKKDQPPLDKSLIDLENMEQKFDKKDHAVFNVPVKDFSGKIVGKVVFVKDIDELISEERHTMGSIVIILAATTVGLMVAIMLIFTILIHRPLSAMGSVMREISAGEGDLTKKLQVLYEDEIGRVALHFNLFIDKLSDIVRNVAQKSSQLTGNAENISAMARQNLSGAEEIVDKSQSSAAAAEETSLVAVSMAQNALHVKDHVAEAKEKVLLGRKTIDETIAGMKKVAEVVNATQGVIVELGESSNKIGVVLSTIDSIADQTNMLALNAAIEAARAGEAGRGFAVVADEVRKLAERTQQATKDIAQTLKIIQNITAEAVTSMNKGIEEVRRGMDRAETSGNAFTDIVDKISLVNDEVSQLATAIEEQSATATDIARNIEMIDAAANQFVITAKDTANNANDVSEMSKDLADIVGQFKT